MVYVCVLVQDTFIVYPLKTYTIYFLNYSFGHYVLYILASISMGSVPWIGRDSISTYLRPTDFSRFKWYSSMKPCLLSTTRCNFTFLCYSQKEYRLQVYMVIQHVYLCIFIDSTNIYWMTSKCYTKSTLNAGVTKIRIIQRQPSLGSQPGRRCLLHVLHKIESALMVLLMSCSFLKT